MWEKKVNTVSKKTFKIASQYFYSQWISSAKKLRFFAWISFQPHTSPHPWPSNLYPLRLLTSCPWSEKVKVTLWQLQAMCWIFKDLQSLLGQHTTTALVACDCAFSLWYDDCQVLTSYLATVRVKLSVNRMWNFVIELRISIAGSWLRVEKMASSSKQNHPVQRFETRPSRSASGDPI